MRPATNQTRRETSWETRWETRFREGRHTIQHQGGHPEKALRTPNNKLFAKKCKIRPLATKRNKKRDKLGDKLGDKTEDNQAGGEAER